MGLGTMGLLLAACLAAIRFGWQIATLTGGAPRKFLSAGCSIKDARLGESETSVGCAWQGRNRIEGFECLC